MSCSSRLDHPGGKLLVLWLTLSATALDEEFDRQDVKIA
jgi:hypothetical protein